MDIKKNSNFKEKQIQPIIQIYKMDIKKNSNFKEKQIQPIIQIYKYIYERRTLKSTYMIENKTHLVKN